MQIQIRVILLQISMLVAAMSSQATATEHEEERYGAVLEACFAEAGDYSAQADCIGVMSTTCMDSEEGGHSTLGMTSCLLGEARVWDRFLNEEYKATRAYFDEMDVDEREYFPAFARRVEALLAAQRAWIAFRDTECDLAYAEWGSGSMRNIAGADCQMRMTAERTIELRAKRETFE